jgi:hypothetical protein
MQSSYRFALYLRHNPPQDAGLVDACTRLGCHRSNAIAKSYTSTGQATCVGL